MYWTDKSNNLNTKIYRYIRNNGILLQVPVYTGILDTVYYVFLRPGYRYEVINTEHRTFYLYLYSEGIDSFVGVLLFVSFKRERGH